MREATHFGAGAPGSAPLVGAEAVAVLSVGQLRAELVRLPDDLPVIVLVQDGAGGTFYDAQCSGGWLRRGVDRDDPLLAGRAFPLQTQVRAAADEPASRRRH
jgi:hypothetical protein